MRTTLLGIVLFLFWAASASAQAFVGPSLDWSHWSYPKPDDDLSGSVASIGGFVIHPALRAGYLFPGTPIVASADLGLETQHTDSYKYSSFLFEPGVGYAFLNDRATNPYVAASFGWYHLSEIGIGVTQTLVGAGIGVRHRVAAGHGYIRGELRYDHVNKTDTKEFILPESSFGVRVGCDLLLSK